MDSPRDRSASPDRVEATRRLEQELGVLVRRVRRNLAHRARTLHPELAAGSYSLLLALRESAPMRSSELADLFSLDKGAVSRRVQLLVDLGLVERRPDPEDGRAQLLTLTDRARTGLDRVDRERRDWYDGALSDWSTPDIRELVALLSRYNATLG